IAPLTQSQSFGIDDGNHRPVRRIASLREKRCARLRVRRGFAENPRKCLAKTALRFKAAAVACFVDAATVPHLAQGYTHSACAMISLKSHSVMPFELTSRGRWIDRQRTQLLVFKSSVRRALHFR